MPASDLNLLIEAAREAGEIALRYWRNDPQAWEKSDGAGPVSEADLAINRHLEQVLRPARPHYGWLSEESADEPARLDADHCFILDPIDGTRAFLAGQDGFSHSLAIATGNRITAAVVHLPARDLTYTATEDGPALLNGSPLEPAEHDLSGARVLTSKPSLDPTFWQGAPPPIRREFRPSLAWRLCLVAEGRFNAALSTRAAWEWDIAAGSLIASRAGATVTDRLGHPLRFNTASAKANGVAVATPSYHAELMSRLSAS